MESWISDLALLGILCRVSLNPETCILRSAANAMKAGACIYAMKATLSRLNGPTAEWHLRHYGGTMPSIMRIWRGNVSADRAAEYLERVTPIALADYRRIPGNRGAWVLSRSAGEVTEIMTLSLWDSMTSICAFAGDPPDRAKYYNFDAEYLLSLAPNVEHWQVQGD